MEKKAASEFIGTFCLVFAGTGAIVINDLTSGMVTHLGIAMTFGLIVVAMIYALGDTSGAHLNPAATASGVLKMLFPQHPTLGSTLPTGSDVQSLVLELILTAILMFVILCVSSGAKEKGIIAGIAIGSVVGLEAFFASLLSGASTVSCVGNSRRNRMLVRKCRRTRTAFFDR